MSHTLSIISSQLNVECYSFPDTESVRMLYKILMEELCQSVMRSKLSHKQFSHKGNIDVLVLM